MIIIIITNPTTHVFENHSQNTHVNNNIAMIVFLIELEMFSERFLRRLKQA